MSAAMSCQFTTATVLRRFVSQRSKSSVELFFVESAGELVLLREARRRQTVAC